MKDRRMKAFGLFTALSLVACLIASGVISDSGSSYAATSSLKWTRINIPSDSDMQLYPGSDIGPLAVTADGATVFAAVQDEGSGDWALLKSIDAAYSWQGTGLSNAMASQSPADTGDIVAVVLSPSWSTDGRIFTATANRVYISEDRGSSFSALTPVPGTTYDAGGTDAVTSLALGKDSSNKIVVAVGTADSGGWVDGGDVHTLLEGSSTWVSHSVGTYDVLAVGLSPSYTTDQAVVAVVTDGSLTMVRTKLGIGAWGAAVNDATFKDRNGLDFPSYRASIGFPLNYIAASGSTGLILFVGLSAAGPRGDVFNIQWTGWPAAPIVTDCQVRGYENPPTNTIPTETNIWSIAVASGGASTVIVAGTETVDPTALPSPPGQFLVYTSVNSGASWTPGYSDYLSSKQPTGENEATVAMASSVIYIGTSGGQSAVSAAAMSSGAIYLSWNQRGLIDTVIDEITDMSPSEGYFSDGTMFITTYDILTGDASLWRTQTEGRRWERVYCSTLTGSPATCMFDTVRLVGSVVILVEGNGTGIVPSFDGCISFQATRYASQPITAFAVEDENTFYTGDASGGVWRSEDAGVTWSAGDTGVLGSLPITVVDLVLYEGYVIAGTDYGLAIISFPGDFEFLLLGRPIGGVGDEVRIAWDPYDEYFIYAGVQGGASNQGIWRYDISLEGDEDWDWEWEQIAGAADVGDISGLACDEQNGILYAVSPSTGTGWRCVDPRTAKDEPFFEEISTGLGAGDTVMRGLRLVSGPTILFAVGGASYTQIWTTSDEIVKMKLLAPASGSVSGVILEDEAFLGRAMVRLEWKEIEGATSYEVQIAFDEAMDSPVDISYYADGNPYSDGMLKVAYPWLGTKYYWRVRVGKAGPSGTEGAPYMSQWSETWSFNTPLGPAPSTPVLLGPQAGQEDVMLKPVLQWNSSVAATGYELILAANCNFENPVLNLSGESAISDTAYQLTFSLAKNTNYCWKVRGVNDITHSPWSDTGTFTTGVTDVPEDGGLPVWIWVVIVLGAVLVLSIVVLIVRSRWD